MCLATSSQSAGKSSSTTKKLCKPSNHNHDGDHDEPVLRQRQHNDNGLWPLSPASALVLLATVVPTSCYLNRGFTQWFHWIGVWYFLSQWKFLEKFQIISGTSICLGWYASLMFEFLSCGRFCHALYKNMPFVVMQYYLLVDVEEDNNNPQLDLESNSAIAALGVAHLLDILAHPLLTYYFWRRHAVRGDSLKDALTWPAIISAYLFSRLWSLTHTKYNQGEFGLWYFGFDVYVMDSLDAWYPAYIAESYIYASLVIWKLSTSTFGGDVSKEHKTSNSDSVYEKKPELLLSQSTISITSRG